MWERDGEMAQQQRVHTALSLLPAFSARTHIRHSQPIVTSGPGIQKPFLAFMCTSTRMAYVHADTHNKNKRERDRIQTVVRVAY